jgi:hypothetical protein
MSERKELQVSTWVWIVIAIAALIVVAAVAWNAYNTRRRKACGSGSAASTTGRSPTRRAGARPSPS